MVDRSHCNNSLNHLKLIRNFNLYQPCKLSKFTDRLNTCKAVVNKAFKLSRSQLQSIPIQ